MSFVERLNSFVWSPPLLGAFFLCGLYFSMKTDFFQLTGIKHWLSRTLFSLFRKKNRQTNGETSVFGAVCTALGASIGTGNIVGVATAITMGGPGAVFWLLFSSLFSMMLIYAENFLGAKYRYKNAQGKRINGAYAYMEKGLNARWMGLLYAFFMVFSSLSMGNMAQSNSIASALTASFSVPPLYTGLILAVLIGFTLMGGRKRIAGLSSALVPFMGILYLIGGLIVIVYHRSSLGYALSLIWRDAFRLRPVIGGGLGFGMMRAMRYGVARGVFTHEAGIGTSLPLLDSGDGSSPEQQGLWGMFQVFIDTFVICTVTALAILMSGVCETSDLTGAPLSSAAFKTVFGGSGGYFISISIVLFAFATLTSCSLLGLKGLEYMFGSGSRIFYIPVYLFCIVLGCINPAEAVFSLSDIFNGLMAMLNLTALFLLRKQVQSPLSMGGKNL